MAFLSLKTQKIQKIQKMIGKDFASSKILTRSERVHTLGSIGLAQALDSADKALLPSVLKALERDLGITPSTLSIFALAQTLCGGNF